MDFKFLFFYFLIYFSPVLIIYLIIKKYTQYSKKNTISSKLENERLMVKIAKRNDLEFLPYTKDKFFLTKNLKGIDGLGFDLSCENSVVGSITLKDKPGEFAWGSLNFKNTFDKYEYKRVYSYGRYRTKAIKVGTETEEFSTYYYYISHSDLRIPYFFMRDEHALLDTVGKVFGGQDINFTPKDEFSSSFVLQGEMEEEIKKTFTPDVRRLFANLAGKKYYFEGEYDFIVVRGPILTEKDFFQLNKTMQSIVSRIIQSCN